MAVKLIDLSATNVAFVRLQARVYEKPYTPVPNSALPSATRELLDIVFSELTGEPLDLSDCTLLVKSNEGIFTRMFTPLFGVNKDTDKLTIKWGTRLIDLELSEDAKLVPVSNKGSKIVLKAGTFNFSGRGEDTCVYLQMKHEKDTIRMPLVVRSLDWEQPISQTDFEVMLEEEPYELLAQLAKVSTGSGGSTTGSGDAIVSFQDLEVAPVKYKVVGYKEVKVSYGINHILTFEDGTKCWSHVSIKNLLLANLTITPEQPAELTILSKTQRADGKYRISASLTLSSLETEDNDSDGFLGLF